MERIISWFYYIRAPWYHLDVDEHNKTVQVSKYMSIRQVRKEIVTCKLQMEYGVHIVSNGLDLAETDNGGLLREWAPI